MPSDTLMGIGKFIAGALIGALALAIYNQTNPDPPSALRGNATWGNSSGVVPTTDPNGQLAALSRQLDTTMELTHQLGARLEDLSLRLSELELAQQQLHSARQHQAEHKTKTPEIATAAAPEPQVQEKQQTGVLTLESLVEAGIDQAQADYILQRQNQLDMQRLELRDRAIREGTLGSKKYTDALRELNQNNPELRDEVGDDVYDRYLYAQGQHNRVLVTSVIPGSAADQAGIREGDMILNYADSRIFTWPELRQSTTEGYLGEYITLKIQRDQQTLSMLVPRGPLGVRMKSTSAPPLDNPGY